jgi:tetratricopeptide (TPR) repeat protein
MAITSFDNEMYDRVYLQLN